MTTTDIEPGNPTPALQAVCPQCGKSLGNVPADAIPPGVRGWSWGAFFLNVIWAIGNRTWLGLLMFVPYLWFVMPFVLGYKGREWAWKNRRWDSVEQFNRVQRAWTRAGIVAVFAALVGVVMFPIPEGYVVKSKLSKVVSVLDPIRTAVIQEYREKGCVPAMHTIVTPADQGKPATPDWAALGYSQMPVLTPEVKRLEFSAQENPEILIELDKINKEIDGTTVRVKLVETARKELVWQFDATSSEGVVQSFFRWRGEPAPAPVRVARCR